MRCFAAHLLATACFIRPKTHARRGSLLRARRGRQPHLGHDTAAALGGVPDHRRPVVLLRSPRDAHARRPPALDFVSIFARAHAREKAAGRLPHGRAAPCSPLLYQRFHKMHHRFRSPEAICGTYCHPVEMMLVNAASMMVRGPPARLLVDCERGSARIPHACARSCSGLGVVLCLCWALVLRLMLVLVAVWAGAAGFAHIHVDALGRDCHRQARRARAHARTPWGGGGG